VFAVLDQRIAAHYHTGPMDLGDATAYLRHQLGLAGSSDQRFADDAIVRLHRQANGVPIQRCRQVPTQSCCGITE
jgi:type II secretory pathway predicted ATPase ExeA